MATPVGTNILNSLSRRHILPSIVDMAYQSNAMFFRLNSANKKSYDWGTQIEQPWNYAKPSNGGPMQGFEVLDVAPSDTVKDGAWDVKESQQPVTIDQRTLILASTPIAVANLLQTQWEIARMNMADQLGNGVWSNIVTDFKALDGLNGAVDAGGVSTTYAGLTRSANTWLNASVDTATTTLSLAWLRTFISNSTVGGYRPSVLFARSMQYNRLNNLMVANQYFRSTDDAMTSAGFTNLAFEGIPFIVDDKVPDGTNSSNSQIYALNEDVIELALAESQDFRMIDFVRPANQIAYVAQLYWAGNVIVTNPRVHAKATAIVG